MEQQSIIQLKNLTKQYDNKVVVDSINLDIRKGEFVTFLGPSGCGKTTTLRMIAGFETPTQGEVFFNGEDIANIPPHKRNVNTVFQKYALFPHYNVFNNVAFGLKLQREAQEVTVKSIFNKNKEVTKIKKIKLDKNVIAERVRRALKIVGLSDYEKRDVNSLSGGQQQRVAIARAIVNEPEILLLDEPLGALDLKMRQEMQLELKKMHKLLGITFIYVTHDQEEALTMSDTVVVMRDGVIMQEGTPTEIYNDPINAYVADFIGESNILDGVMAADKKVTFGGMEFECVDVGFERNADIDVVIRPEDIILGKPGKGLFDGVITNSIFRGVHYEMTAKALGLEFIIHSTLEQLVGSQVSLYVKPYDFHIMHKEHYDNVIEAVFTNNETMLLFGVKHTIDPTVLLSGVTRNDEGEYMDSEGNPLELSGKKAAFSVRFTDVDLTDDEADAPLAGNIYSMIYKGKNYLVTIKVGENQFLYADTEYLWDDGDRIGIKIPQECYQFINWIDTDTAKKGADNEEK